MIYKLLLFWTWLLIQVNANLYHRFIIDYFVYKKTPSVVGFSCNLLKDDLLLQRSFNNKGIIAALSKIHYETKIELLAKTDFWKLGVFIDARCFDLERIASVLVKATHFRLFDDLHHWLILSSDLTEILNITDDEAFGVTTDYVIAVDSESKIYQLYDVYNLFKERGSRLNVTFLGEWSNDNGINIVLTQPRIMRRANMNGVNLKAIFWKSMYKPDNMSLKIYFDDYDNATKDGQSKFGYHMLHHLSEMYNFTLQPYETPKWVANDSLGPISRALLNKSADFTGTPISMNVPRTYLFKYVHQDWPFRTCFMFRNPQPKNIKVQELLRPLKDETWYLMGLLFIVCLTILSTLLRFEGDNPLIIRISNSFLVTTGAICQQGTDLKMKRLSTRITFLFIMIFSLLMYNYYSASVVSARLDEPIFKINDSLIELGKLKLKLASEWMVYFEFFLKKPDYETRYFYENSWIKTPESERYMAPEVGMKLVKNGDFAYHTHPDIGYRFAEKLYDNREICELMEVHLARLTYTAFGVTLNSSFTELARIGMVRLSETGIRYRQIRRWQYRKPKCYRNILSASSITIYEFAPHLLLLLIGMTISASFCIIEFIIINHRHRFTVSIRASSIVPVYITRH